VATAWRASKKTDPSGVVAAVNAVLERLKADRSAILSSVARHCLAVVTTNVAPEGSRVAS
jgi:hypothetical protein